MTIAAITSDAPLRKPERSMLLHPAVIRITHWINAIGMIVMIMSGWRIYNNLPILNFSFPVPITLGGDPDLTYKLNGDSGFGNALLWHFAGMWLVFLSGVVYLSYGFASGRLRRKLLPIAPIDVLRDVWAALRFKLPHDDISRYNAVQRLLYAGVIVVISLMILSGLALWKPVQFQELVAICGSFHNVRVVHFIGMSLITGFLLVHVMLALLVPRTIVAMITGRAKVPVQANDGHTT